MKTCWDCLFYGARSDRDSGGSYKDNICLKRDTWVDDEQTACQYFLDENHKCCLDCSRLESASSLFGGSDYWKCTAKNKKISNAGHYYCDNFRY